MINSYNGEIKLTLFDKVYPMRINLGVIAKFQSETGKCFNSLAVAAINSWQKTSIDDDALERAEMITAVVSMEDAATIFYLAAKEMDSQVTFEEIQEAVLLEGVISRHLGGEKTTRTYPILFTDLAMFALSGIYDKKKVTN